MQSWSVLARRTLVADRWLTLHAETVRTATGVTLDPFYVIDEHSWACVLPVLPDGRVVLVEQYRHGAQRVMLELPAGDLEPGEHPAAAALRELAEETGYAAIADPVELGVLWPEPARNRSTGHGFLVRVSPRPRAQATDATEDIAVRVLAVAELLAACDDGRMAHGLQVALVLRAHRRGLIA